MAWPTEMPHQSYAPTEPLRCPRCRSHDVDATLRDPLQLSDDDILVDAQLDPLSYGLGATCNTCGHEWKPNDDHSGPAEPG